MDDVWIKWLIILIVVVVLTTTSIHLLLKKGFDYNRVGRYISLLGTIVGIWTAYYELYEAGEPHREKWRQKRGEKRKLMKQQDSKDDNVGS